MCFPEAMWSLKHQKQSLTIQPRHTKDFSALSSASSNTVCLKATKKKKKKSHHQTETHRHTQRIQENTGNTAVTTIWEDTGTLTL